MPPLRTKPSERRETTRATTGKWKYWVGHLILDRGRQGYPYPDADGPPIDQPVCKPGATMPVSGRTHWGMITTDIKQVEWYAAQYRAWGVAVYFENLHADDGDKRGLPVFCDDEFIGWLYNPADADLAQSELDERERRAAERREHCAVVSAKGEKLHATIKARCIESGCSKKFGEGCPRSEHKHGGCVELIDYYRRRERDDEIRPSN
jgi:hypothetical protein